MRGPLLCLASAACFSTLGVFGKLASDAGANVATTLFFRFSVAAALFWLVLGARGRIVAMRRAPRRLVLIGLALGAAGYSLQSTFFFAAIENADVSLVSLVLYTYPAFVTVAALVLGRAEPSLRIGSALVVASVGLVLVLLTAGTGTLDLRGGLFALAASVTYTTYILISDRIVGAVDPFALSTLVLTGATASFVVAGAATGSLHFALPAEAYLWLVAIAVLSTVVAVSAFFAGLRRVGPSEAAILSTFEPVATVALAFVALGERLTVAQLAGGALVLGAVIVLQLPARRRAALSRRTALRAAPAASAPSGLDASSV
jgi:drug/metabolite transporter (DMT)-like permease